jgi:nucleoside-diphosphate-sugar epimerase|tara:strand:- start:2840 stop:3847 length:1008 start_codon:yes stop_codon:yes gene_type:complete
MSKPKRALITGGLGFIGSHCIEKWGIEEGWDLIVVDNKTSNSISEDSEIAQKCQVSLIDLMDIDWDSIGELDMILHLASPVGPVGVLKHSGKMAQIIIDDIYKVIEGAKINKCPLIFVSTSEIYGHREEKTYLKEHEDKVLHGEFTVRNEYAIAKLLAELAVVNTGRVDKDFKYQIIRPFNVTGERQLIDGGFVLPRFADQALRERDITVYFDGLQMRAFTWVKDIVNGIWLCSQAEKESNLNQEWNIGNEQNEETILYLAQTVKELTNSSSNIAHVDPKILHGDMFSEAPEKIPDSQKIMCNLGWTPTKSTNEIIEEVVQYYVEIIKSEANNNE